MSLDPQSLDSELLVRPHLVQLKGLAIYTMYPQIHRMESVPKKPEELGSDPSNAHSGECNASREGAKLLGTPLHNQSPILAVALVDAHF
jgi:hypothetical protein